jgi:prophage antirepressor-like protein
LVLQHQQEKTLEPSTQVFLRWRKSWLDGQRLKQDEHLVKKLMLSLVSHVLCFRSSWFEVSQLRYCTVVVPLKYTIPEMPQQKRAAAALVQGAAAGEGLQGGATEVAVAPPRSYSWTDGQLLLGGVNVPVLRFEGVDDIFFKAKPIHNYFGCQNIGQTLARVDDCEKGSLKAFVERYGEPLGGVMVGITPPNHQEYNEGKAIYVNESGLYKILLGSKKPDVKPFRDWVCREVLPSIRKTGGYQPEDARPAAAAATAAFSSDGAGRSSKRACAARQPLPPKALEVLHEELALHHNAAQAVERASHHCAGPQEVKLLEAMAASILRIRAQHADFARKEAQAQLDHEARLEEIELRREQQQKAHDARMKAIDREEAEKAEAHEASRKANQEEWDRRLAEAKVASEQAQANLDRARKAREEDRVRQQHEAALAEAQRAADAE